MARYPEGIRRITLPRLIIRFFTGRPLDGIRRTDAVFLRPGRKSMDPSGYATRWALMAGYQRLLVRLGVAYIVAWIGALLLAALVRAVTEHASVEVPRWADDLTWQRVLINHLVWMTVAGLPLGTYWWVRQFGLSVRVPVLQARRVRTRPWVRVTVEGWVPWTVEGRRTWERTYVRPVAMAASNVLGTVRHPREARKWVHVPANFRDPDGSPVRIQLPANFTGADEGTKRRLVSAVGSRLGLRDPSSSWELEGDRPRLLISAPPVPPDRVTFAEVRDLMEGTQEYEMFLGLAARRKGLTAHLAGDSPHIAMSAGSGAGKSEMLKVLAMQALRWGWGVIILDWKEVSQSWAADLPGVLYCRDIEDIHDMGVRLGQEVDLRKAAYRQDPTMPGRSKVLVLGEEMNVTAALLQTYWSTLRQSAEPEERRTMPLRSPAMDGLMAVNFGGRQFGMFMVYVAQRFSARVTNGNADLRESFQIRLMARASSQTWKMLAPQIKPIPKMSVQPGRWAAVIGEECVMYQAPLITDEEAREFAMGGLTPPSSPLTSTHRPSVPNQANMDHELGESLGHRPALPNQRAGDLEGEVLAPVDARKLSEMVDGLSHLGITLDILRHASKDPESGFPGVYGGSPNRGYTYDYELVKKWARKRHARQAANGERGKR